MHAAVVHSADRPPHYDQVDDPVARAGQLEITVVAAGVHPLVRAIAAGRHYSGTGLPRTPGVDGVGRLPDGTLAYLDAFGAAGTLAERIALEPARCLPLPAGVDAETVAAVMNPGVSGWLALHRRAGLRPGEKVLVLGATGAAGSLAVQLARRAGASSVVAAGRNRTALAALTDHGADRTVPLDDHADTALAEAAADADVVVDYLWGPWTERALTAIADARPDPARPLRWVQVGTTAGPEITLPGAVLRRCALELLGSGPGAVPRDVLSAGAADLLAALPGLEPALAPAVAPLRDVERVWAEPEPTGRRLVLVP